MSAANFAVVYWIRGKGFADMAAHSMESVRKAAPGLARFVAYTDDALVDWELPGAEIRQLPPGRPAMVANLDAQCDYLLRADRDAPPFTLFLDVDTIMLRPFPFETGVDLFVTWRDHVGVVNGKPVEGIASLMPYNYGVVGCKNGPRATEAFLWMRARILQMSAKEQNWYGNQLALADLCAAPNRGDGFKIRTISWALSDFTGSSLIIKTLPCDVWNYTPEDDEDASDRGILHFKGNRKHMMQRYVA